MLLLVRLLKHEFRYSQQTCVPSPLMRYCWIIQIGNDMRARLLVCCRELNSMDVILYQAGKQQLLRRREDLHAAHWLEGLPHLQARDTTLQSHRRPAAKSDLDSPGLPSACCI